MNLYLGHSARLLTKRYVDIPIKAITVGVVARHGGSIWCGAFLTGLSNTAVALFIIRNTSYIICRTHTYNISIIHGPKAEFKWVTQVCGPYWVRGHLQSNIVRAGVQRVSIIWILHVIWATYDVNIFPCAIVILAQHGCNIWVPRGV